MGRQELEKVQNFIPIGVHSLPEYPEQKLFYPPFLQKAGPLKKLLRQHGRCMRIRMWVDSRVRIF